VRKIIDHRSRPRILRLGPGFEAAHHLVQLQAGVGELVGDGDGARPGSGGVPTADSPCQLNDQASNAGASSVERSRLPREVADPAKFGGRDLRGVGVLRETFAQREAPL
jgi:hypothetical protein